MPIHGYPGNVITANPTAPTSSVASGVWTTEQQLIAKAAGNWPFTIPTQQISRSLRFNSADSAYLNRTFSTPTSRQIFTFSAWVKRGSLGTSQAIIGNAGTREVIGFFGNTSGSGDSLHYRDTTNGAYEVTTTAVFRDPSAWYHIVVAFDTTQATASNRVKMYVNGVQQTAFNVATYPSQNANLNLNSAVVHAIGRRGDAASYYYDGYLTEIYFIDGQQLTPSSFGQTNASTGVWEPIAYTGTYGNNGFYLNFSDNSGTTSTTLGKDYSGNGNNWTPNNFSVTAGVGNDSLVDTPTSYGTDTGAGGEVRGNYCVWNPINIQTSTTISEANLKFLCSAGASYNTCTGTISVSSGKWYWELTYTGASGDGSQTGILASTRNLAGLTTSAATGTWSDGYAYSDNGNKVNNGSGSAYGSTYTTGDVIGVALDLDAGTLVFYKNNTSQGTAYSSLSGSFVPSAGSFNSDYYQVNFGQRPFAYTAPSGFKALCTQNLPTPTIGATSTTQANDYFNAVTYTGTAPSTQAVTGVGFQPDFVWVKSRSLGVGSLVYDAVRGAGSSKALQSNATDPEGLGVNVTAASSRGYISSFDSDGFTAADGTSSGQYSKANTSTYVAWNWNAGGSNATNTAGSITSTVRANTTSGFSIVSFNAGAAGNKTVGHGLSSVPSLIIMKDRQSTGYGNWSVFHSSVCTTTSNYLLLNGTGALGSVSNTWGSALPTSSVFGFGSNVNIAANDDIIAYCFAPVAGYSAFGSYTGNGSTDGPFVYLGFRPEFVMIKNITTAGTSWEMFDNARETSNLMDLELLANSFNAEGTYTYGDFVSNGFKLRSTNNGVNQSTATLVYMAFAENPFKYALAR